MVLKDTSGLMTEWHRPPECIHNRVSKTLPVITSIPKVILAVQQLGCLLTSLKFHRSGH